MVLARAAAASVPALTRLSSPLKKVGCGNTQRDSLVQPTSSGRVMERWANFKNSFCDIQLRWVGGRRLFAELPSAVWTTR